MKNYSWVPTFIISLDQLTKRVAMFWEQQGLFFSKFYLQNRIIYNKGISFGMFSNSAYQIILYILILSTIIFVISKWMHALNKSESLAWGMILGGGISNFFDRFFFGGVLDFIECQLTLSSVSFPVFNIADIAVFFGFLILLKNYFRK